MITNINPTSAYIMINKYNEQHGENVSIGITNSAEAAIQWAMAKMAEEQRIAELARTNPTVADAAQAVKTAEEQLKLVVALVE
jgi:3-dehydroquinate synthetase